MSSAKDEPNKRRAKGDGGLRWDDTRKRWIAEVTVAYDARGKRIVRSGSGKTQTEALDNMRKSVRRYKAGLKPNAKHYTVGQAVESWLAHGQSRRAGPETRSKNRSLCEVHILAVIGDYKLHRLTLDDLDVWLEARAEFLATRTLGEVKWCLTKSVKRAVVQGLADRTLLDTLELCEIPEGRPGRPSKSLTLAQAEGVLTKTRRDPMHAYIAVSLLTGVRTEEARALRWDHVHLDAQPPNVWVWRSVREKGDTKTEKSRRTLALPRQVADVLRTHKAAQAEQRLRAGKKWNESGLVFTTGLGTELDAANVRRSFRRALRSVPGIDPKEWTPRELRHSFVSLLSMHGVSVEKIARLVGHKGGSTVTERVYRHELHPELEEGAQAMDELFDGLGS